ncbi:hypothetical protein EVAR_82846_1 [Eumeta japonica]|uniref:Uncharacterized protein n=1 Tax=Eumeta variegata TaxID=151549 RepID=A0A4C1V2G5_EUMVA|nr:hypothetical protein EVAR_82846_1 [Eumeta japonica]
MKRLAVVSGSYAILSKKLTPIRENMRYLVARRRSARGPCARYRTSRGVINQGFVTVPDSAHTMIIPTRSAQFPNAGGAQTNAKNTGSI